MKNRGLKDFLIFLLVSAAVLGLLGVLIFFGSQKINPEREPEKEQLSAPSSSGATGEEKSFPKPLRKPAVSGQFYPDNPKLLQNELNDHLSNAEEINGLGKLRILYAPHAGTQYSGNTAAWGFKQIQNKEYSRVILLGSSHKKAINHAGVYSEGSWETPLGKVAVDSDFANKLLEKDENIITDNSVHKDEHSLEMELIFLQSTLDNFKIVPILLGNTTERLIEILSHKIAYLMDDETLLVVSTDLSHYPNWEDANYSDNKIIESILTGKRSEFEKVYSEVEKEEIKNLDTCACAHESIKVALAVSELLQINEHKKLHSENSGDITGDKDRVVGYASIGSWSEKLPEFYPDEDTENEIIRISRNTLETYISSGKTPEEAAENPYLHLPIGVFTTLRIDGKLRGCIGQFEPNQPLYKVVQSTTISSASKDIRFKPVKPDELDNIHIEISMMTPRRKVDSWEDIKIGEHGVVLSAGGRSGTFLPQVATENNWGLVKFLEELCSQKVGVNKNCYKDPKTQIYVFSAHIIEEHE